MAERLTYEPVTTEEGHYIMNDQGEYLFRQVGDEALFYDPEESMVQYLTAFGGEGTSGGGETPLESGENVGDAYVQDSPEAEPPICRFWNSKPDKLEEYEDMAQVMLSLVVAPKTYAALNDTKTVKRQVWQQVAKSMAEVGAPIPSKSIAEAGEKCSQKYRNITKSYKKYKLKLNETGTGPTPPPKYFDLVHPYFVVRADINPQNVKNSRQSSTATTGAAAQSREGPESLKFSDRLGDSHQFTSSHTMSAVAPAPAAKPRTSIDAVCRQFFASPSDTRSSHSYAQNSILSASQNLDSSLSVAGTSTLMGPEEEHIMENPDDVVLPENGNALQASKKSRHSNVRKRVKPRTTASNSEILTYVKESDKKDEEYRKQHLEIYKDEVKQNGMLLDMMKNMFEADAKNKKRARKLSKRGRYEGKENRYDTSDDDDSFSD